VFPDSSSGRLARVAPDVNVIPISKNLSVKALPGSTNPLSPISYDTTLAFSVPLTQAPDFLSAVQEIAVSSTRSSAKRANNKHSEEERWIMKAAKSNSAGRRHLHTWASDAWTSFVDLLKVRMGCALTRILD
jgi:hydroxymethylglutaryl-CoA reductase (NADPH)